MRRRRFAAVALVALVVALIVLGGYLIFGRDDNKTSATGEPTATPTAGSECTPAVFGKVMTSDGQPVAGAIVTVSGPFKNPNVVADRFAMTTTDDGLYYIGLPIGGDYQIRVDAWGFVSSHLVGYTDQVPWSAPQVQNCEATQVQDITLQTLREFTPAATGTDAFVYGKGVEKDEVCAVVLSHNLVANCDEFYEPVAVKKTGQGWTTYVRGGQSVSTVPINYDEEPFWEVRFKSPRPDGLTVIYVQRKCGNVSAPPGEKMPSPIPPPAPAPTATPTGEEVPTTPTRTSTPVPGTPQPPTATKTPVIVKTNTPVPPSATVSVPPTATVRPPTQTPQPRPTQPSCNCPTPVYAEPTFPFKTATPAVPSDPEPTVRPPTGPSPTPRPQPPEPTAVP